MICNYSQLDMYLFNGIGIGFDNFKKMRYRGLMRAEARCRMTTSQDWLLGRFTPDHSAHSTSTFTLLLHIFTSSLFTSGPASAACSPGRPAAAGSPRSGGCCGSGGSAPRPANTRLFASYFKLFSTIWNKRFGIKGGKKCRFEIRTLVAFILCFMTR